MYRLPVFSFILIIMFSSALYADTAANISGEYSVTGTYVEDEENDYQYYHHELDLFAVIRNDTTVLRTEIGITDKTYHQKHQLPCFILHTDFILKI